ncbi:hypothetical protein MBLNU230_g4569t1 [Neophaeotheca triangularis]
MRSYDFPSNAATSFNLQSRCHVNLAGRGSEALMVFASGEITCSHSRTSAHPRPRTVRLPGFPDGISLVDVQSVLSRHFLQNQRDRSIFSSLVEPGGGIPPHEAASAVLQELASKTEKVAVLATLAHRLTEAKALWKGHPDPSVKSAEDLIRKLDAGSDVVRANLVIGASALRQRQSSIQLMEEAWRPGWFDDNP